MTEAAISAPIADEAATLREAARDPTRFAEVYRRYVDDVYRYLLARTGSASDAEDLVAETFLAALSAARHYRGSGAVKAWLFGIARRKAADARRSRRSFADLGEAADRSDPLRTEEVAIERTEVARVVAAMGNLSADRAEALRLRFFAGLELAEIAALMGRSEAAVKMLVHRGLGDLRHLLREE